MITRVKRRVSFNSGGKYTEIKRRRSEKTKNVVKVASKLYEKLQTHTFLGDFHSPLIRLKKQFHEVEIGKIAGVHD